MSRWIRPATRGTAQVQAGKGRRTASTCTSVVLRQFGPPERLEVDYSSVVPALGANEVLVRVKAAAVNPLDIRMREGYGRSLFGPLLPLVLGRDVSGQVAAAGASARGRFAEGQDVFGALHPTAARGAYSEYALLEWRQLAPKPPSLSHVEAAAIPFAALTAWRALEDTARIKSGQRLLVMGGGGAVGLSAIQLAAARGCQVATTCGSSSMEEVKEAGATLAVHYASPGLQEELGGGFDAVLDTIGVEQTESIGVNVLKRGGTYMTLQGELVKYADKYGLAIGGALASAKLAQKQFEYHRTHGIYYAWTVMRTDMEGLEHIAQLASNGRLRIPVGKVLPLESAAEAHVIQDRKLVKGKVVLEVG